MLQNNITQLINEGSRQPDVVLTNCLDCVYNLTMDNKLNQAFKTDHLPYSIQLILSVTQSSYYRSSVKRTKRDFSVVSLDKGDGRKHYRMCFQMFGKQQRSCPSAKVEISKISPTLEELAFSSVPPRSWKSYCSKRFMLLQMSGLTIVFIT